MADFAILVFLAVVTLIVAKPVPDYDLDGQEILKGSDTRYYGLPGFWYQRPFNGDDNDDYGANDANYARPVHHNRGNGLSVYEAAGSGWGR